MNIDYETLKNNTLSIDCVLLEKCNLNCLHCFQNHTQKEISIDYLKSLPNKLNLLISALLKKHPNTKILKLSIRGGELFQDSISDEFINTYKDIILSQYSTHKIKIQCHVMSNGIYNNIERVINFLKDINSKITLSYDSFGRFTSKKQRSLFINNFNELKNNNLIENIAITLTKPAIKNYVEDPKQLKVFENINLDINNYVPTKNKDFLLPTDEDIFIFFKTLLDNDIFNCIYLQSLLENTLDSNKKITKACNCKNTVIFYENKLHYSCNIYIPSLDLIQFYGKDFKHIKEEDAVEYITKKGMTKRNCFLCEHYNNCSMYCWMQLCHEDYVLQECPHRKIRQYIKNNPDIIKRYLQWKK